MKKLFYLFYFFAWCWAFGVLGGREGGEVDIFLWVEGAKSLRVNTLGTAGNYNFSELFYFRGLTYEKEVSGLFILIIENAILIICFKGRSCLSGFKIFPKISLNYSCSSIVNLKQLQEQSSFYLALSEGQADISDIRCLCHSIFLANSVSMNAKWWEIFAATS